VIVMGRRERFPETSWTLLARAREQSDQGARAREEFAQRYYRPVQQFLLLVVQDGEQARELAQEFFTKLSGPGGLLEHARREKGAFRDYLSESLRNLVRDYYRHNRMQALQTHPDQASAGGWDVVGLPGYPPAEAAFHREWVKVTLAEALTRVRALCLKRNQQVHLDLFAARYLSEADAAPSWEELGACYGMDQKTARDRADTVVRHFRLVLRRMLRNEITVPSGRGKGRPQVTEAAVDEEIEALLSPLQD
jgi:DNA-directed RNA polymerase specialized sigma24 family protein